MANLARFLAGSLALTLAACTSSYITPGRQADLATFTNPDIKKAFTAKPAITFPATIAVVRVQDRDYRSASAEGVSSGAYSVVTNRDLEIPQDLDLLSTQPGVGGVVNLNRLLLPKSLSSDLDLRLAAAKLQADVILVYTMDTILNDDEVIAPLTVLTLGLAPNKPYKVSSTASAILMDTKTGYIYGALEEIGSQKGLTIAWGNSNAIEAARHKAERQALTNLLNSFPDFWKRVYAKYRK